MSLSTLMVRTDLEAFNDAVLEAAHLAGRFKAGVVGIAGCPMQMILSDGYVDGGLHEQDRAHPLPAAWQPPAWQPPAWQPTAWRARA